MNKASWVWMDGEFKDWDSANVHILTHTIHYGNAVFEGTRAYMTDKGLAIYRLQNHTKRLLDSAKMALIDCKYSQSELNEVQIELLKKNGFKANVYIRPFIFIGFKHMGVDHSKNPVHTAVCAWEWDNFLGDHEDGIRVKISSFARNSVKSSMGKGKIAGNYFNSQMARAEALKLGFDEALLLDEDGFVAEGSGECFFMVVDKVLITPPNDNSLKSITQDSVLKIAKDMGLEVHRRRITRDEAYVCDEAFFTGTAAEVTPIKEIDFRVIGDGKKGSITDEIRKRYFDIVYARDSKYDNFLTFIR